MENKKISLKDGLYKQNIVFMSGLVIAPAIACATTLMKSLAVCLVFSLVSFFTIMLCRAVPRKIAYTLRVIIYSLAASALYIPTILLAKAIFGMDIITAAGVYLPVLVTNSLILSKAETRFYGEPFGDMVMDCAVFIAGFDIACIFTGAVRELFAKSTIGGAYINMPFTIPALETTFGGFLFIGVCAGIFRGIYNYRKEQLLNDERDEEDDLLEYAEDMGEFLTGKKHSEPEKIKIYKASKNKKREEPENILDMSFNDNSSVLDEFAAIVAEGAEITAEEKTEDEEAEEKTEDSTEEAASDEEKEEPENDEEDTE
ncbi:MAG: hypothetical protein IJZ65_08740 [Ruminiclostridium sp.]|nr:hypothetical protein [Ruminiclostridium sp.]